MKNVCLKFIGTGYYNICQALICVYDECNNLVYEGVTCNGCVCTSLCVNKLYKVRARSFGDNLFGVFYVRADRDVYSFTFPGAFNNIQNNDDVTFQLTDAVYDNLPIVRGEMSLWQR